MNIFVVSQLGSKPRGPDLISQMSSIYYEQGNTVPVIVVDDSYNLPELSLSHVSAEHAHFNLDEFRRSDISSGVEPDKVARGLDQVKTRWIVIDFGRHDHETCADFISKLACYSYLSPALRNRSLVFSVPVVSLGTYARALNESFNNLSVNGSARARSRQIRRLLVVTNFERALISLPLPLGLLRRAHNVVQRIYSRIRNLV